MIALVTTDDNELETDHVDVAVIDGNSNMVFMERTSFRHDDPYTFLEDLIQEVKETLREGGWCITSRVRDTPTGFAFSVEKAD